MRGARGGVGPRLVRKRPPPESGHACSWCALKSPDGVAIRNKQRSSHPGHARPAGPPTGPAGRGSSAAEAWECRPGASLLRHSRRRCARPVWEARPRETPLGERDPVGDANHAGSPAIPSFRSRGEATGLFRSAPGPRVNLRTRTAFPRGLDLDLDCLQDPADVDGAGGASETRGREKRPAWPCRIIEPLILARRLRILVPCYCQRETASRPPTSGVQVHQRRVTQSSGHA